MKYILISIIFLCSLPLFPQSIAIIGGLNQNSFFDFKQEKYMYSSSYSPDLGYVIRIGLEDIKVKWLTMRFTLSYDKYGGKIATTHYTVGSEDITNAEIDKSVISLGIFPINFTIIDRISINLGFEMAGLISEDIKGTKKYWVSGQLDWMETDLNDIYKRYSARTCFGLRGRIAYSFRISDHLAILPQYSYYLGLSHEFVESPELTKSMRHYFCVGLQRKIK
ncbi:MAG: hypothetical protein ACWGNV_09680 [Bacteroidales bacterium]